MTTQTNSSFNHKPITERFSVVPLPKQTPGQSAQKLQQRVECVQSLELVQTLVCATVSTVASLRCLFPENCFRIHHYDIEKPNCSYKDFIETAGMDSTVVEHARKKKDHRYVPWEILVRGTNPGADKLLDWVELGVADALNHRYLTSLQLGIYDGEVSPSKRVEVYIMTFSYTGSSVKFQLQLPHAFDLPTSNEKTVSSAKQELRFLVHRLTNHIGGFPELPPRSIVNMHFTYNSSCPPAYQPPGFVMCQDHGLVLQSNEGALVGGIYPGQHHVDLRVFVNERRLQTHSSPNPLTMVTLRGSNSHAQPVEPTFSNRAGSAITQEAKEKNETENIDQPRRASIMSNVTGTPNTQERIQLTAIAAMARLRSTAKSLHDTQLLEVTEPEVDGRQGSIDLDGASSAIDCSSTQGTPSTVGGHCARQSALRSGMEIPSRGTLVMPAAGKRQLTIDDVGRMQKLRKISKAKSPFATAFLKK